MLNNKRGFSMVELLAMIIITSAIIFPLLTSLVDSFEVNSIMHDRKSAITITETTIYAFNKLTYSDLANKVDTANASGDYYIELTEANCTTLVFPEDEALCLRIFDTMWNNLTFDETTFRVFIFDYSLTQNQIDTLKTNTDIPSIIRDDIALIAEDTNINDDLLRIYVWIKYADGSFGETKQKGLINK